MVLVTSDTHFGHWAPWVQQTRPFSSVEEMDQEMILQWNRVVGDSDLVYHLGDFTLGGRKEADHYFKQLSGEIRVLGNRWHHDKRWIRQRNEFGDTGYYSGSHYEVVAINPFYVLELVEYGDGKYPLAVTLTHFPFHEWDRKHYGGVQLHGHTHLKTPDLGPRSINVCVEQWDYAPVPLDTLIRRALNDE